MPSPWPRWLRRAFPLAVPAPQRHPRRPARAARVRLHALEDRTVPAVYAVTTTADVVDPGDGVLSVREAVLAANASPEVADTINLPEGTFTLTRTGSDEDAAATGDLDLWADVTIRGLGAAKTIVDGNRIDRVFDAQAGSVIIAGLAIRNGSAVSQVAGSGDGQGGGVRSRVALTLTDCVITSNHARGVNATVPGTDPGAAYGGGVYQLGSTLTLTGCTVSDNEALGGTVTYAALSGLTVGGPAFGGGVYVAGGSVTLAGGAVAGNRAAGGTATNTAGATIGGAAGGGGIAVVVAGGSVPGTLTLSGSLVAGNRAEGGAGTGSTTGTGGAADGGGILVNAPSSADVRSSTVAGNGAVAGSGTGAGGGFGGLATGGGLALGATGRVSNSTVSGNRAAGGSATTTGPATSGRAGDARGGGLVVAGGQVTNSTVTLNAAAGGTGNRAAGDGLGGGAAGPVVGGGPAFRSTILAGNSASAFAPDLFLLGPVPASQGNNLVGDGSGATGYANGTAGDQVGGGTNPVIDARLGTLADNGGPTPTHAPLTGSPAINRGSNPAGLASDQRGPGFPRVSGPAPDVGAVEASYAFPWAAGSFVPVTTGGDTAYTFTVTYRDDVGVNVDSLGTGDVRVTGPNGFSAPAQFIGVDVTTNGTPRVATYRITPPGGTWDASDNGVYTVAVEAGQATNTLGNAVPDGALGTFAVTAPPPSAAGTFADVTTFGATSATVSVTYSDGAGIRAGTLGTGDVRITGPNGFSALGQFVGVDVSTDGTPRAATYRVTAPGGDWDGMDNGTYTVAVEPNQVTNTAGFPVPAGAVGTFRVTVSTFRVTNADDAGPGSLRAALSGANALAGPDTVVFDPGFFAAPRTITFTAGEITVTDSVTVSGPGANRLTVSGNNASRIFRLAAVGTVIDVTLSGLTLANGRNPDTVGLTGGGAITDADENLTLTDMVIRDSSGRTFGGGVYIASPVARVSVLRSTFANNSAEAGGGLYVASSANTTIIDSTFSGNRATNGSAGGLAVNNSSPFASGSFEMLGSTVSGNVAANGDGGGIHLGNLISVGVANSTIAGNTASTQSGFGGGLAVFAASMTSAVSVRIENSTITGNSAGAPRGGGGVYVSTTSPSTTTTVTSSIISGNSARDTPDLRANNVTLTYSAVGSPNGIDLAPGSGNNLPYGVDLRLAPLDNYGGPTRTIALRPGSPALDRGSNPFGLTTDQRGAGFPRTLGLATDIGAFEGITPPPTAGAAFADVTTAGSTAYTFTVRYADDVGVNVATLGAGDVRVTGPDGFSALADFVGVDVNTNGTPRVATYRLTPPGGSWDGADIGAYAVSVELNQVADTAGDFVAAGPLGTFRVILPATFVVTTAADSGPGSLRDAVARANANAPAADTIVFAPAFFSVPRTITLTSGQLTVTDPLAISGPGAAILTVSGNSASRLFTFDGPGQMSVALTGMTLANGRVTGSGDANSGGAILNRGEDLTIQNAVLTGNSAEGGGGAVSVQGTTGSLTVRACTFDQNTSAFYGGAIWVSGTTRALTLVSSTVSNNTAWSGGGVAFLGSVSQPLPPTSSALVLGGQFTNNTAQQGGGLFFYTGTLTIAGATLKGNRATATDGGAVLLVNFPTATIQESDITGNTAYRDGGGVGGDGKLTLLGSTVAGNVATFGTGGGLALGLSPSGIVATIRNSTISGNSAPSGAAQATGGIVVLRPSGPTVIENSTITTNVAGPAGDGAGGLNVQWPSSGPQPAVTVTSTILTGNTAGGTAKDLHSPIGVTLIHSALGAPGTAFFTPASRNNLPFGVDLKLGPLADNGGPTRTHALLPGSPAIDTGVAGAGLLYDQRGSAFNRRSGAAPDIGAFEFVAPAPSANAVFPDVTAPGGTDYTFTVNYFDDVGLDVRTLGTGDVRVTGPNGFSASAAFVGLLPTGNTSRAASYRLTPPGGSWTPDDAGNYIVTVEPNQVADSAGNFVPAGVLGVIRALLTPGAGTFIVSTTADDGPGSLRDGLALAATAPTAIDAIIFDPVVFGTPRTITLTTGPLAVTRSVAVLGPGADRLTVNGNNLGRVFIVDGPGTLNVTLAGMTLTGGRVAGASGEDGGAVSSRDEALTVRDCTFTGNYCFGNGGAVAVGQGGSLTILHTTFAYNTAVAVGGAVFVTSPLTVQDSTFFGNVAKDGGGMFSAEGTSPRAQYPITVLNSLFANNTALTGSGGGFTAASGVTLVRNSTFSANAASMFGGGLVCNQNPLTVTNSTFTGNTASQAGGGIAFRPFITFSNDPPLVATVIGTIATGNRAPTGADLYVSPPPFNTRAVVQFSAIGNALGFQLDSESGHNLPYGVDVKFGPLADNGGPTMTHALLPGSPAIDAGSNPAGLAFDQRGFNYARVSGTAADVGAFEVQRPATVQAVVINGGAAQRSRVTDITVTFDHLVTLPADPAAAFRLTRTGPGGPAGAVTLTVDLSGSTATRTVARLTFAGPLTEFGSLMDGNYALTVFAAQVTGPGGLPLDGDGDGAAGGDYAAPASAGLFRLFGDANGDRAVNGADFAHFRAAFGTALGGPGFDPAFDFNGDGFVNGFDFGAFRIRFGAGI